MHAHPLMSMPFMTRAIENESSLAMGITEDAKFVGNYLAVLQHACKSR